MYTFKAIKNNIVTKEVTLAPSLEFALKVRASKYILENKDTYDVSRVSIKFVDQNENLMNYANKAVKLQVKGPITLLCDDVVTLLGGQISVYVKSLNQKGNAQLIITCEQYTKIVDFMVK